MQSLIAIDLSNGFKRPVQNQIEQSVININLDSKPNQSKKPNNQPPRQIID